MKRPDRGASRVTAATWGGVFVCAIVAAEMFWGQDRSGQLLHADIPSPVAAPSILPSTTPVIEADPLRELQARHLDLPVRGVTRQELRDSFADARGRTRKHEAIDILAPRNTPVVAVEAGRIARLFESEAGGTTVYQFDPASRYVYYYAHLERYADGLDQDDRVARGQVLGYVGTSGNAPPNTPHLHFAIFRLTEEKRWWQGTPIDPYLVFNQTSARTD